MELPQAPPESFHDEHKEPEYPLICVELEELLHLRVHQKVEERVSAVYVDELIAPFQFVPHLLRGGYWYLGLHQEFIHHFGVNVDPYFFLALCILGDNHVVGSSCALLWRFSSFPPASFSGVSN